MKRHWAGWAFAIAVVALFAAGVVTGDERGVFVLVFGFGWLFGHLWGVEVTHEGWMTKDECFQQHLRWDKEKWQRARAQRWPK